MPPFGRPSKWIGSPHAIDTGWKLPGFHVCEPWIATGIDRNVLLQRDHRGTRLKLTRDSDALAGAFGEETEGEAVAHDPAHRPHGVAVGLAAAHGEACRRRG